MTKTTQKCANFIHILLGRRGHRTVRGHCMGCLCPSCVLLVYSLRKSTEFHIKGTERQRILFHFLLLIFSSFLQSLRFCPLPTISVQAAERPRRSQSIPQHYYPLKIIEEETCVMQ